MKWFGEDWGAPVCDPLDHISTPVGMNCLYCPRTIAENDQGFAMDYYRRDEIVVGYAHRDCLLNAILGPGRHVWSE